MNSPRKEKNELLKTFDGKSKKYFYRLHIVLFLIFMVDVLVLRHLDSYARDILSGVNDLFLETGYSARPIKSNKSKKEIIVRREGDKELNLKEIKQILNKYEHYCFFSSLVIDKNEKGSARIELMPIRPLFFLEYKNPRLSTIIHTNTYLYIAYLKIWAALIFIFFIGERTIKYIRKRKRDSE